MAKFIPKRIIIHCADTPDYAITSPLFDKFGVGDIDVWHRQQGMTGCGYHFVIRRTGKIEEGRNISIMGAHVLGENHDSIGICWIGRTQIMEMQLISMANLCHTLMAIYSINKDKIFPHNLFNKNKICPGFDIRRMIALIK